MAFIESETESDIDISEEEETFEDILSDIDISEEEERESTLEDILSDPGDPEPSQSAAGESSSNPKEFYFSHFLIFH